MKVTQFDRERWPGIDLDKLPSHLKPRKVMPRGAAPQPRRDDDPSDQAWSDYIAQAEELEI